ncbi:MAG TPA: rod-binding protein [Longimicrobiales bacterium]|jgi:flagellar protein FlgJ
MSMRIDPIAAPARTAEDARLQQACAQLEGVFFAEMMKALRDTIPTEGLLDGGAGERIFSGLLDEHLSALAASRLERGLGAALYNQLRGRTTAPGAGQGGTGT